MVPIDLTAGASIAQRCRVSAVAMVADPTTCWPWDSPPVEGLDQWRYELSVVAARPDPATSWFWTAEHVGRVLWLMQVGWDDPIEIDVGMGDPDWWPVIDGNHRLAAAILRGDHWILVEPSGDLDDANRLLSPEMLW